MMNNRKVVVVTGASQGLGAAFLQAYRARGWRAVGNARGIAPSKDPDYITVAGDIGDPQVAREVVKTAIERFGRVDTLINNAGIWRPGRIEDITEETLPPSDEDQPRQCLLRTQAAVPAMKRQGGGHIIQVSTSLVEHALQNVPAVVASLSKGAGVAATRGLAMELVSSNIRVNTVSLGIVVTPLHDGSNLEDLRSFSPMNRNGKIEDVVRAVNYLEDADYVTAEIMYVDGGRIAGH